MFDLSGMTALVTGASGGLGSAIAKALAGQGARLAVSGSNVDKLEAFRSGLGGDHVAVPCNLSDAAAVDALVPQAVEALGGKLDILVNNAGVTRDGLIMRMKDEDWDQVISVNLEAAFRLIRASTKPIMKAEDKSFQTGFVGFGSFDDTGRFRRVTVNTKNSATGKQADFFKPLGK